MVIEGKNSMTNMDESGKSWDFFQDNNAIKKKKKKQALNCTLNKIKEIFIKHFVPGHHQRRFLQSKFCIGCLHFGD